jgi:sodium transport system permease protein
VAAARADEIVERLEQIATDRTKRLGLALGVAPPPPLEIVLTSIGPQTPATLVLGYTLPMVLFVLLPLAMLYPAVDATAGERERKTWDALLVSGASHATVATAKYLYVTTMGIVGGGLSVASLLLTMGPLLAHSVRAQNVDVTLPGAAPFVVVICVVLAASMVAGPALVVASTTRSTREAQALLAPFLLALLVPAILAAHPSVEPSLPWSLVPIVNLSLLARSAVTGTLTAPFAVGAILAQVAVTSSLLWIAAQLMKDERWRSGPVSLLAFLFATHRRRGQDDR